MKLIKYNRKRNNTNDALESYYLEAWLGKIQSDLNDLPQYLSEKIDLINNNNKIKKLKNSLTDINKKAKILNLHNKKGIPNSLKEDFQDLLKRINKYAASWDRNINERKAIYYYYAESIIDETNSLSDNDLKIEHYKDAIDYLNQSVPFYKNAKNFKHADETLKYQKKVTEDLKKLEKLSTFLKIKKTSSRTEKLQNNFSKDPESSLPCTTKHQTGSSSNDTRAAPVLPPKKRKNWVISNAEEPTSKKPNISSGKINITTSLLLQFKEKEFKSIPSTKNLF